MFEAGIRHNQELHVAYQLDNDNGDMNVKLELKTNDGTLHIITGQVVWDE